MKPYWFTNLAKEGTVDEIGDTIESLFETTIPEIDSLLPEIDVTTANYEHLLSVLRVTSSAKQQLSHWEDLRDRVYEAIKNREDVDEIMCGLLRD